MLAYQLHTNGPQRTWRVTAPKHTQIYTQTQRETHTERQTHTHTHVCISFFFGAVIEEDPSTTLSFFNTTFMLTFMRFPDGDVIILSVRKADPLPISVADPFPR